MSKCTISECGCETGGQPDDPKRPSKGLGRIAFLFACAATGYGLSYLYNPPEFLMKKYSIIDMDKAEVLRKEKAMAVATASLIAAMSFKYDLRPRLS